MANFIDRIPSYVERVSEALGVIRSRRPDASTVPGSDADILAHTLGHLTNAVDLHLYYGVLLNLIPTRASGWVLDAWAYIFGLDDGSGGLGRIKARGSTGTDAMTIRATAQKTPDYNLQGSEFVDSAGQRFQIAESVTQNAVWAAPNNAMDVDVAAIDVGLSTNVDLDDNEVFAWTSTPELMSDTLAQAADFDTGADKELDPALRTRLLTRLQTPAQGGNWSQWVQWIENTSPGSLRAYVWPGRQHSDSGGFGHGTTDYLALQVGEHGDDMHILSTDALYTAIAASITEYAPVLLMRNARQLTISAVTSQIELSYDLATTASAEQKTDFDSATLDATAQSYTYSTKEIVTDKDVTAYLEAGTRVIFHHKPSTTEVHAYYEVEVVKVGTADSLADDLRFTVSTWPWGASSGPSTELMAGGGLTGVVLDGLQELADNVGPAAGPQAAPISGWIDTVKHAGIKTNVINSGDTAIIDMTIALPVADLAPAYSDGATVQRLNIDRSTVHEVKT
jgi:hypothetical protein